DQSGLPPGASRFIISLRAVGEGHISSITFRSGVVDAENNILLDEDSPYVTAPEVIPHSSYDKALFGKKLVELEQLGEYAQSVLAMLEDNFTLDQLKSNLALLRRQNRLRQADFE